MHCGMSLSMDGRAFTGWIFHPSTLGTGSLERFVEWTCSLRSGANQYPPQRAKWSGAGKLWVDLESRVAKDPNAAICVLLLTRQSI